MSFPVSACLAAGRVRGPALEVPLPVLLPALPVLAALLFAMAAAMHYGAAVMHQARDLPDLPLAMIGGATAGAVATLLAIAGWAALGKQPFAVGVVFAGLCGEYLGGKAEDIRSACLRGLLSALVLLPAGTALLAVVLRL
jgi:hypothetical protein